jgi:hypothetical protein
MLPTYNQTPTYSTMFFSPDAIRSAISHLSSSSESAVASSGSLAGIQQPSQVFAGSFIR